MLQALYMCPGCRNGTALFAAFRQRVFVWYRQFFRHNKGKSKQMTDENFVLCKETLWTKPNEYINPCLVNYEVTSLSTIVTQRRETSKISGSFAPAPAARHVNSSNCWKPCRGDEIHAFSLPSGTARDTDLKPESFFSWRYMPLQ